MKRPFVIGLTGSIGMGKTTTADMFRARGVPVWDADAAVHRMYAQGGAAVDPIARMHPQAILDGAVDRERLKAWIADDEGALSRIEAVVHPLLQEDRRRFLASASGDIVVLDFPLLLETGADRDVDMVVVVSAPAEIQRARLLERGSMSSEVLDEILSRQMPDEQKRARADFIIPTTDLETARRAVDDVLEHARETLNNA